MLKEGDFVTAGTCTDVYMAHIGDKIRADFADLGCAELELALSQSEAQSKRAKL